MKKYSILIAIIVLVVLVAGGIVTWIGYQNSSVYPSNSGAYPAISSTAPQAAVNPVVPAPSNTGNSAVPTPRTYAVMTSGSPALGPYLVAKNGMTLYHFTQDTSSRSTCYGQCASFWPAYVVSETSSLDAAPGILGELATTMRTNGLLQATYNGHPLYFWHADTKPGDTLGQGVGGTWFVVTP